MTISQISRIYSYSAIQRYMTMLQSRNTHHTTRHYQKHYPPIKSISTTRLFSSTTDKENINIQEQLDLESIPYPTHYSPTSLETFKKCPQAFFFLYILKLTQDPPMTEPLARGIICHTALEEVFDLKPQERTLANLENLLLLQIYQNKFLNTDIHNSNHIYAKINPVMNYQLYKSSF